MLRATTACTFSTSQLPKVLRTRQFLTLSTSKCASHYNGLCFFNFSTSKSARTRQFFTLLNLNLLRATTACTFSISQFPKVLRTRQFLTLPDARLRTSRFGEPTLRPSEPANHWKNTMNRDFSTFSRACVFFLLYNSFPSLIFSILLFCHRCFSIFPYCRKIDF